MKTKPLKAIKFAPRITKVRVEQRKVVGDLVSETAIELTVDGIDIGDLPEFIGATSLVPMPIVKP